MQRALDELVADMMRAMRDKGIAPSMLPKGHDTLRPPVMDKITVAKLCLSHKVRAEYTWPLHSPYFKHLSMQGEHSLHAASMHGTTILLM